MMWKLLIWGHIVRTSDLGNVTLQVNLFNGHMIHQMPLGCLALQLPPGLESMVSLF